MCGILGILPPVSLEIFNVSLKSLAHRGPDGNGIWCDLDNQILLGHTRLSILDVTDSSSQPMHYLDRYHCVFNGEIYNYLEIRKELESFGYLFKTNSDTEVLIASYAKWGHGCLNHLNGMWAFAIWDSYSRELFLARDRMGKKPLFYVCNGNTFAFASEQKALLPFLKDVKPSENFQTMCDRSYLYEATDDSLFDGIYRFPAAHYAYFVGGNLKKERYWSIHHSSKFLGTYSEQIERMSDLLLDSVRLRLRSDVAVGTGLSGGIDSSLIAAAISRVANSQDGQSVFGKNFQSAFVASFPNSEIDETNAAKTVANHLGIGLSAVKVNPAVSIDSIERWAYLFEEIHEVNWIPHICLYRGMRDAGIKVAIDGHGGDELFCGYETSVLHALVPASPNFLKMKMVVDSYRNIYPDSDQFGAMNYYEIFKFFTHSVRSSYKNPDNLDALGRHLYELSFITVLPTLLRNYDRYSMINGVEIRMPLLDYRIVELAFNLPWDSKVRNGFSKAILRDIGKPWLPESILNNKKKKGFAPPIVDWLRGPLKEYMLDEMASSTFLEANLVQPKLLSKSVNQILNNNIPINLYEVENIWKKFNIYLWEKSFLQKKLWKL